MLIGHVPEKDSEKRIKFHTTKRLYHTRFDKKYDIETANKNIFKAKYVALYSKKDKEIIGYAKVEEIDYVINKTAEKVIELRKISPAHKLSGKKNK